MQKIGIFGGTFDPVHQGHLQMALEARAALGLDEVRLIPCHIPPHRETPNLSGEQRLQLLNLAVEGHQGLVVDDRELRSENTSYTVDTLLSLRQELGDDVSLVLMMGMDAFAGLTSWNRWQQLRALAHIVVMARPDSPDIENISLKQWLSAANSAEFFDREAAGGLAILNQSLLAISSTQIRTQLAQGKHADGLPTLVAQYVNQHKLYQ